MAGERRKRPDERQLLAAAKTTQQGAEHGHHVSATIAHKLLDLLIRRATKAVPILLEGVLEGNLNEILKHAGVIDGGCSGGWSDGHPANLEVTSDRNANRTTAGLTLEAFFAALCAGVIQGLLHWAKSAHQCVDIHARMLGWRL
jgi:hypothetical protein